MSSSVGTVLSGMSSVVSYASPIVFQITKEYAPTAARTVIGEIAKKRLEYMIGSYLAGPTVFVLINSLPLVADNAAAIADSIILGFSGNPQLDTSEIIKFTKGFCGNRVDFIKLFISTLGDSPANFIYHQSGNLIKAVTLDYACQEASKYVGSYSGSVAYAIMAPTLIPNASPLTLPIGKGILQLTSYLRDNCLYRPLNSSSKKQHVENSPIELDDFKQMMKKEVEVDGFVLC